MTLFERTDYLNLLAEQAHNRLAYAVKHGKRKRMIIIAERQKAVVNAMLAIEMGKAA